MQQLSEQILSFTIKVKCPKTGEEIDEKFTRLAVDHLIYGYEDALGRVILLLQYVDDIGAATIDRALREILFHHIRRSGQSPLRGR